MIDIVFLLIIFFLVSSHLARQEVQAEVNLPKAETGADAIETNASRVTINLTRSGDAYVIRLGSEPVNALDLENRLRHEIESGRDLEVRIRADRAVPYAEVQPVMLACAKAGVWNVAFAVIQREATP